MTPEAAAKQIQRDYLGDGVDLSTIYSFMDATCDYMSRQQKTGTTYEAAKASMEEIRSQMADVITETQFDKIIDLAIRGECPELLNWK